MSTTREERIRVVENLRPGAAAPAPDRARRQRILALLRLDAGLFSGRPGSRAKAADTFELDGIRDRIGVGRRNRRAVLDRLGLHRDEEGLHCIDCGSMVVATPHGRPVCATPRALAVFHAVHCAARGR